jgi:4-hydroxybenzoate polyprenyltransferase
VLSFVDTRRWRDLVVVHRWQYPLPIAYLCYAIWGACYAVSTPRQLLAWPVATIALAAILLFTAGLALNTVADVRTDEQHEDKGYLATTVRRLGRDRAVRWMATEAAIGLALAATASAWTGRWLVAAAALAIGILHLLYNTEPIRLKHRGFTGAFAFGAAAATLPCLMSYAVIRPGLDSSGWLIFVGIGVLSTGRTAWWSVPDVVADTKAGAGTPAARHGAPSTVGLSCLLMLTGLTLLGLGIGWRYGPGWALTGIALHVIVLLIAISPLLRSRGLRVLPSSKWMRTRVLMLVTLGEIALVVVPLANL